MAHAERSQVTAAYVHAEYPQERRRMMPPRGDDLDKFKADAEKPYRSGRQDKAVPPRV